MGIVNTVRTQIRDYPRVHRSRLNLSIHLVAIPLLWAGLAGLVASYEVAPIWAAWGLGAIVTSIALQALGHGLEAERAQPFTGPGNFLLRLTTESLIVFPLYALSGGLARAWRTRSSVGL